MYARHAAFVQLVKEHSELATLSFDFRDPHVVEDSQGHKTIYDAEDIKGGKHTLRMTYFAPVFAVAFLALGIIKYFVLRP